MNQDDGGIGYRQPPKYTQFQKGKSGNPKGRPRKIKDAATSETSEMDDILRKQLDRKLFIRDGTETKQVTVREAISVAQQKSALGGSVAAQRDLLRSARELEARDAERKVAADKKIREDQELEKSMYDHYVRTHLSQTQVYAQAKAQGIEPNPRYPHPEDIIFDHNRRRALLIGPSHDRDDVHFLRMTKQRDVHFFEYIILNRQRPKGSQFDRNLVQNKLVFMDSLLPKRMRIIGVQLGQLMQIFFDMPIKELRDYKRDHILWIKTNPAAEFDNKTKREVYKQANAIMKPLLKQRGYRSIAHLESVCANE
jgi:hypothetical protein